MYVPHQSPPRCNEWSLEEYSPRRAVFGFHDNTMLLTVTYQPGPQDPVIDDLRLECTCGEGEWPKCWVNLDKLNKTTAELFVLVVFQCMCWFSVNGYNTDLLNIFIYNNTHNSRSSLFRCWLFWWPCVQKICSSWCRHCCIVTEIPPSVTTAIGELLFTSLTLDAFNVFGRKFHGFLILVYFRFSILLGLWGCRSVIVGIDKKCSQF